jgi:hypothetical protein
MPWPRGKTRTHSAETRAKMSAAAFGRPKSAEARANMSAAKKGRTVCRPFTAEDYAKSIATRKGRALTPEHRAKLAAAKIGKPGPWLGRKRGPLTDEWKAKQSASLKGKPAAFPLRRFYYRDVPFRSTYEVRAAQSFDRLGMRWEYEPKRFDLGGSYTYLPDFYLPDEDMYVEVKGYYGPKSAETMSRMFEAHPDVSVAILQRLQIEALEVVAAQVPQCVNS